jgi:hypothetical protein
MVEDSRSLSQGGIDFCVVWQRRFSAHAKAFRRLGLRAAKVGQAFFVDDPRGLGCQRQPAVIRAFRTA